MVYSFAARLKKARIEAGLTQVQLAKLCGQVESWASNYETDIRKPSLDSIRMIMKALKVDANYLLN